MPVFTYKCPACGGPLKFDPSKNIFTCEYCDSVYEESYLASLDDDVFDNVKEADKSEDYGKADDGAQMLYSCPSCGAEIVTDDTTAATMCYYCHNPVVLTGRLAADMKPDAVLPFKLSHDEAKGSFLKWISKKRYIPKGFASEKLIDSISGVYYPYWLADYSTKASYNGEGRIITHTSDSKYNITTTKIFSVVREGNIEFRNVSRAALKKADRKLSDGVIPYETDDLIEFQPSYLSGFMAEKRDVDKEDISQSVEDEIKGYAPSILTEGHIYTTISGNTTMIYSGNTYKYSLLPAWVLTYKGSDGKIYYYSTNGQTGKTCGILPVDRAKLALHSAVIAGIVALLIGLFMYFIM